MLGSIKSEIPKYLLLKQRLLADYDDLDEETLADTLEGITDLHEMIAAVIRSALVDEALQTGLRIRLEEMRERLIRLKNEGPKSGSSPSTRCMRWGSKSFSSPTSLLRRGLARIHS